MSKTINPGFNMVVKHCKNRPVLLPVRYNFFVSSTETLLRPISQSLPRFISHEAYKEIIAPLHKVKHYLSIPCHSWEDFIFLSFICFQKITKFLRQLLNQIPDIRHKLNCAVASTLAARRLCRWAASNLTLPTPKQSFGLSLLF